MLLLLVEQLTISAPQSARSHFFHSTDAQQLAMYGCYCMTHLWIHTIEQSQHHLYVAAAQALMIHIISFSNAECKRRRDKRLRGGQ